MDEITINKLLKDVPNFIGTYPLDLLPTFMPLNTGLIANTHPSTKSGEHWVAIFKDKQGYCEYFDSYGLPPMHTEFLEFLSSNLTLGYNWNKKLLQCIECITCGYYCVEYIKCRSKGLNLFEILASFTTNPYINDIIIKNKIKP